ncbi:hypothetical protein BJ508DRAFT_313964 [Ascobolus immersus RN42]|uniref:BTB domain-containing protein n=1 Tax=Ascobolus immersus RN42 TaxID=1160509 RepID=A0A3N4HGW1_ASCIM|nr:hypothetical protein BJ508DRAFT_313964 [Ascobolus immersus RN42]
MSSCDYSEDSYMGETPEQPGSPLPNSFGDLLANVYEEDINDIKEDMPNIAHMSHTPRPADCTVTVEGYTFQAHKNILSENCEFFKRAFKSGMREEVESAVFIQEESAKNVFRLLVYIYTKDYNEFSSSFYTSGQDLQYKDQNKLRKELFEYGTWVNICMDRMADKFFVLGLAELASIKQERILGACLCRKDPPNTDGPMEIQVWACRQVLSHSRREESPMRRMVIDYLSRFTSDFLLTGWTMADVEGHTQLRKLIRENSDFSEGLIFRLLFRLEQSYKTTNKLREDNKRLEQSEAKARQRASVLKEMVDHRLNVIKWRNNTGQQ